MLKLTKRASKVQTIFIWDSESKGWSTIYTQTKDFYISLVLEWKNRIA
jgi:hypothetical protein